MDADLKLIDEIRQLVQNSPNSYSYRIKHNPKFKHLLDYIITWCAEMPDLPFNMMIKYAAEQQKSYFKCANKNCNNELRHDLKASFSDDMSKVHCCISCAQSDPNYQAQLRVRNKAKYGVEWANQTDSAKQHASQAALSMSKSAKRRKLEKCRKTCKERYGQTNVSKVKSIQDKKSQTNKSKTLEEKQAIIAKTKKTKLERYGDENYVNSKQISKTHKSFSPAKQHKIAERRKRTCQEKYGVDHVTQAESIINRMRKSSILTRRTSTYENILCKIEGLTPLFTCEHYCEHSLEQLEWHCDACGNDFLAKGYPRCLNCNPLHGSASRTECEIVNFLKSIYTGEIVTNTRDIISPRELDIYLPELKLAIEYDGLYWHSENLGSPNDYHFTKTNECNKLGTRLIHIFEHEWVTMQDVVKSKLTNIILGTKIKYSDIKVAEIDSETAHYFMSEHEFSYSNKFTKAYGLFADRLLSAVITVTKLKSNAAYDWEITNISYDKIDISALGMIISRFESEHHPTSIKLKIDRRWRSIDIGSSLGFTFVKIEKPNCYYMKNGDKTMKLISANKINMHSLKSLVNSIDLSMTISENLMSNNYLKIYDAGTIIMEKIYNQEKIE